MGREPVWERDPVDGTGLPRLRSTARSHCQQRTPADAERMASDQLASVGGHRRTQGERLVIGRFRVRIPVPAPLSSQVSDPH